MRSTLPPTFITDAVIELENTEYFVNEPTGFVEICAFITTSCSECPLSFDITLSLTPITATSNYILLIIIVHEIKS